MIINLRVEDTKNTYPNRYCALKEANKLQKEGKEINFSCILNIKEVNENKRYLENKENFDFLNNILLNDKMPNYTAYFYGYEIYDFNLTYSLCVEFE